MYNQIKIDKNATKQLETTLVKKGFDYKSGELLIYNKKINKGDKFAGKFGVLSVLERVKPIFEGLPVIYQRGAAQDKCHDILEKILNGKPIMFLGWAAFNETWRPPIEEITYTAIYDQAAVVKGKFPAGKYMIGLIIMCDTQLYFFTTDQTYKEKSIVEYDGTFPFITESLASFTRPGQPRPKNPPAYAIEKKRIYKHDVESTYFAITPLAEAVWEGIEEVKNAKQGSFFKRMADATRNIFK